MPEYLCLLGAFGFHSTSVEVGAVPRTINVQTNALATEPIQTVDFVSGFMPVVIAGLFKPPNADWELASLQAEVAKDSNTLLITPRGQATRTFRVFKNENFAVTYDLSAHISGLISYSVALNCLP
jgi:hypothetical protein